MKHTPLFNRQDMETCGTVASTTDLSAKKIDVFTPNWQPPLSLMMDKTRDKKLWPSTITKPYRYGFKITTLRELLQKVTGGALSCYENNRGTGKVAKPTTDTVRDKMKIAALGLFVIARKDSVADMTDGNSRIQGLLERLIIKGMSEQELNAPVIILEVEASEKMESYKDANSGKPHTIGDDLANPDYQIGRLVQEITNTVPEHLRRYTTATSKMANLSYLLYTYGDRPVDPFAETFNHNKVQYTDVFSNRWNCKKLCKYLPSDQLPFVVSPKLIQQIKDAVQRYAEFCGELSTEAKTKKNKEVAKILRCGPFLSLFVMDCLRDKPRITSHRKLVNRCLQYSGKLGGYITVITGGGCDQINTTEANIWSILLKQ